MTMPRSSDQESAHASVHSRHSSVQGPYRQALKETQTSTFPFCNHIKSPEGYGKSYSRSLLLAGHGFALQSPEGDMANRPSAHIESGLCIGDVIAVKADGVSFKYFFNIFKGASDPAQSQMVPPNFEPFGTPLQDLEIKTDKLAAGTVISSHGVNVTRISASPLEINLSTSAREAAFMIFPEGASREDLANASTLHSYVKDHAVEWYRHIRVEEQYDVSNGSLYLVTGCDRPNSQCCTWASIPAQYHGRLTPNASIDIRYRYEGDNRSFLVGEDESKLTANHHQGESRVAVFIRGMRIALCATSWPQTAQISDWSREYYRALSTPTVGKYAKLLQLRDQHYKIPANPDVRGILGEFHPSSVICPVLLQMRPSARLAITDDSSWISVAQGGSGTVAEITDLILRVFSRYKIVTQDDIVLLEPKTTEDIQEVSESRGLACLPFGNQDDEEKQIRRLVKDLMKNHT